MMFSSKEKQLGMEVDVDRDRGDLTGLIAI